MLQAAETVSILQKQPDPKAFSADQVIFAEGQPSDVMYGILEGEVDLLFQGKAVETLEAGEVFGIGSLIEVKTRTYTAVAKTDCKLAFLDRRRFLFAVQETPLFALQVMKDYSQRLSRLTSMLL